MIIHISSSLSASFDSAAGVQVTTRRGGIMNVTPDMRMDVGFSFWEGGDMLHPGSRAYLAIPCESVLVVAMVMVCNIESPEIDGMSV